MRANTIVMVLLAVIFGVVAVVLANMWLLDQRNALAARPSEPQETVVVAAAALKFGDALTTDKLREIPWSAGALPAGAFKKKAELFNERGEPRQALQAIGANEPILTSKITGEGQRATLSAVLGEGMRAVSIRVNDVLGVAGFVFPGDRVDVLLTRNIRNVQGGEQAYVDVLLQSIKVLAVDQVADESKENPQVVKAVTLEVSTKDAQKLTLAAGAGQLSLALRQVASSEGEVTDRVTLADLTGDTPEDVALRQAELDRAAALEAERKRAEAQLAGIREVVQTFGERLDQRVGSVESKLSELSRPQPQPEPEVREVVKEVVKYVQPEPPSFASVGVMRGLERQVYEVPRTR